MSRRITRGDLNRADEAAGRAKERLDAAIKRYGELLEVHLAQKLARYRKKYGDPPTDKKRS